MNNLGDYLSKKSENLHLSRADDLANVQQLLDEWYPGKCRAQKILNGKLTIVTQSSSVANELRFKMDRISNISPIIDKVIIR